MSATVSNPSLAPVEKPSKPAPHLSPEPRRGSPWKIILILLITAALGVAGWQAKQKKQQAPAAAAIAAIKTAKVAAGDVMNSIRVAGQTSSRNFANIVAPRVRGGARDMILLFLIDSGKRVKKGDLLASIDTKSLEDFLDDLDDQVSQDEADIKKLQAQQALDKENLTLQISQAKATLDKAKFDARSAEVKTQIDQELLNLAVEQAQASYNELLDSNDFQLQSQAAALKIQKIALQADILSREKSRGDIGRFKLSAPMDGLAVVQQVNRGGDWSMIRLGDQVNPGQLIAKVVDPNRMQVEGSINQSDNSYFRIGQPANVTFDAFAGMSFPAKVYSIGALATGSGFNSNFVRTLPIRIAIDGNDPRLIPDLSAGADIVISEAKNAKVVPVQAVQHEQGKDFVYVKHGETYEKRDVTVGLMTATQAAVTTGVEIGEDVALQKPPSLSAN